MMRRAYNCHLCLIQAWSAVDTPHRNMQVGTQATMPYFLPRAAPRGCSVTKKAKKRATAVFRSLFFSPMSAVKCADSAFPICCVSSQRQLLGQLVVDSTNICFVERVEEEQKRKER